MRKLGLFLLLSNLLLCSCHLFEQQGPYNLTILTKLKEAKESSYLARYSEIYNIYLPDNKYLQVKMSYDVNNNNFICSEFINNNFEYTTTEKEKIEMFLSDYYFITKEKLPILFPPEKVVAYNKSLLERTYRIKKFDHEYEITQETNYYYFRYYYSDGYLFLSHFTTHGITEIDYSLKFDD